MRISRIYYVGDIESYSAINLPIETSHYLKHVLRLDVGASIRLFNGDGNDYEARLIKSEKTVTVKIGETLKQESESPLRIHLSQAVARGEKMDWILQKAVELGVSSITPLITKRCNVKLDKDRALKRLAHWQKVIISACEQSGRARIPALTDIFSFDQWINALPKGTKLYCDPTASSHLKNLPVLDETCLIIGPEGGLSTEEIRVLQDNKFTGINLGPRILRTETASVTAISILQSYYGDI